MFTFFPIEIICCSSGLKKKISFGFFHSKSTKQITFILYNNKFHKIRDTFSDIKQLLLMTQMLRNSIVEGRLLIKEMYPNMF